MKLAIFLIGIVCLAVFIIVYMKPPIISVERPPMDPQGNTLFACTTFLAKPKKFKELDRALSTFLQHYDGDEIREFLVINEYSETDTSDKIAYLREKYPFITFISKTSDQSGQAKSLNMMIDHLKTHDYKYWLRWEESWYSLKPYFKNAHKIMETSDIDQLQFTYDWRDVPDERRKQAQKYLRILRREDYKDKLWSGSTIDDWPLYSLRPCLDRVSTILKIGRFDESPEKWPVHFEYDYALEWVKSGNKGVYDDYIVTRNANHKSTYH